MRARVSIEGGRVKGKGRQAGSGACKRHKKEEGMGRGGHKREGFFPRIGSIATHTERQTDSTPLRRIEG